MAPTWTFEKVGEFYKITTPELTTRLSNELCNFWNGEQHDSKVRFPGAQPVSIELANIKILKSVPYVVCAKLDGERYILYMTQVPEDLSTPTSKELSISFMVDRNLDFYIITIDSWNEAIYKNKTILDGEFIGNEFVIHDAICLAGTIVKNEKWETRWRATDSFLTSSYRYSKKDTFNLRLKKFYLVNQLKLLFDDIETNKIKNDGLVFYPMNDPVKYRSQDNLYKWKVRHTVDFKIRVEDKQVILETWSNSKTVDYATMNISKFSAINNLKTGDIIEFDTCLNSQKVPEFIPILKRTDKNVGNNLYTVRKTILNAKENISKETLLNALSS